MVPGQSISLQQTIQRAQEINEQKLAAEISIPQQNLHSYMALLKFFVTWTKQCGVRHCPAKPTTIVAWIRYEESIGTNLNSILKGIDGIRALHDKHALPSPIDTPVVRAEIWRLLIRAGRDEPRWSTEEMALFDTLDDAVKEVIVRRAALDSKEVRKAQNEAADLRHKLKQLENERAQLRAATKETEK
jgi:hypothetical protein